MKLGIGIPASDRVHTDFAMSLAYAVASMRHAYSVFASVGSVIETNRNSLVSIARRQECTHLLQMDTDIGFPPDTPNRMFELSTKYDLPILAATYRGRTAPHPKIAVRVENGQEIMTPEGDSLYEVSRIPAGMLLVRMDVFDKIPMPYFERVNVEPMTDDTRHQQHGEDYVFCDKARKVGFRIMLDVRLSFSLVHLATIGVRMTDDERGYEYVPR